MKPEEPVMRHPDVIAQVERLNARIRELEAAAGTRIRELEAEVAERDGILERHSYVCENLRLKKAEADLAAARERIQRWEAIGREYAIPKQQVEWVNQSPGGRDSGAAVSAPSNGPPLATAAAKPPGEHRRSAENEECGT